MAQGWQERLKAEREQLAQRLGALEKFLCSHTFVHELLEEDQKLLKQQVAAMTAYLNVLDLRIRRADRDAPF